MEKTYITLQEAATYAGVSKQRVKDWIRANILDELIAYNQEYVDPDVLDLLVETREKNIEKSSDIIYHPWIDEWLDKKEQVTRKIKYIPTYVNDSNFDEFNLLKYRNMQTGLEVQAIFLTAPFRIISNNYAIKAEEDGYLVIIEKDDKINLRYAKENAFLKLYELLYYPQNLEREEEILKYIHTHDAFRAMLERFILDEDRENIDFLDDVIEEGEHI